MDYWLFKSEPDCYSIDQLAAEPNQTTRWDGIRNFQARNFLRDKVKVNDQVFFYHSRCKLIGVVGIADVCKAAYPDPQQFHPESPYYDPKSTQEKPRWFCVDIRLREKFPRPVLLDTIKTSPPLEDMLLLKQGRLSIQPVTPHQWSAICKMAQ